MEKRDREKGSGRGRAKEDVGLENVERGRELRRYGE